MTTLSGHAAVFNRVTTIFEDGYVFEEEIAPGAFADAIAQRQTRALFNHQSMGQPLGRQSNMTLLLAEDSTGLRFDLDLPRTSLGRDVAELVRRGDLDGMSFAFSVRPDGETWYRTDGGHRRVVERVAQLPEVSIVNWPAYQGTAVGVGGDGRSRGLAELETDLLARRHPQGRAEDLMGRGRPEPAPFQVRGLQRRTVPLVRCRLERAA